MVTKVVVPKEVTDEFLNFEEKGASAYERFKNERLQGEKCIWSSLPKTKLKSFECTVKCTSIKVNEKVAHLKQERKLMTRFIIASRKRADIDLPYYIGTHEFSVVPLSMFNYHGDLLIDSKDKSSVTHGIE